MAKIYECLLSTNILREERRHSFDPQRVTQLGKDSNCMVNLLKTPRVIVFFFYYMIDLLRLFRREVLFCQASMKITMSSLSVHC